MLRIGNWSAVLASWLVILANVHGESAEVKLPTDYRKVQANANEDRSFGLALELNATPLTTLSRAAADSRIEKSFSVVTENIRGDRWSTDNPQLRDEAKSLITFEPGIKQREERAESDQSDSLDSKESCKNEIDVLKWASTGTESPSFTDDSTSESVKHQTKEWSRLTSFKTLRKKSAGEELSDFRRPSTEIPGSMYSQDSRDPIGHFTAQETRLLNPSSTLPSKSADRKVDFALKKEQLQANLEDQTGSDDLKSHEDISQNTPHYTGIKSINDEEAELDTNNRFFDKRDSRPTETSEVTRQSSTIVAGVRETFIDKKSDTRNLSGQRADSYRASSPRPLRTHSRKDNAEATNEPLLRETGRMSDFPIHSNMNKLPNPETTATPSISFSSNTEYTLRKVSLSVNRAGETETSTTVGHEDKSSHHTIKKEHRAFRKFTVPTPEEATRFSLRSQWNEEGDTTEAPRDAIVAVEVQANASPVRFNTVANVVEKQRRTTVTEKTVGYEVKEESHLLPRESVKAKFRVSKRQEVSKEGKDLGEKSDDILHSTGREALPEEATTTLGIHWNVEQTDVTIGRPVIIEEVFASGSVSTTSEYHDRPVKRKKHRNQLLDILGRNIAFSGSSTEEPVETNSKSGRSSVLQQVVTSPTEKQKASVGRANVLKVGTAAIASKEDRVVIKAPEKDEPDRNENARTAKAAFQSERASGELDYTRSKSEEADSFETGLRSKYKAIPSDKHRKATFEASYERHSMPDHPGKQSRNPIMRERYASDARREMTGQLTEAKAASNMEREDRPSIAARNVEVPYTNSATGHPGDPRDQWIARNPKIERVAVLNLTGTVDTQEELTTEQQTNENPPLPLSSICQDQNDKKECVNEDDRQDLYDSSTERQMATGKDSMEESQLAWNPPGDNESSKFDKSRSNEATEKYIELARTTEKGSGETTNNGSYTETDKGVNRMRAKETSAKGATTPEPNRQDDSYGIPSVTDTLRERHSRAGRFWHVRGNQSLAYIGNSSSSTLPQEANTERQPLDRASDDLAVGEEYDPLGTAATSTKIDLPPQTSSPSFDGISSSSDRAIDLETGKPVTRAVEMETLDVASTNWSGSYTDDSWGIETTTLRETVSKNDESLMEKKHSQRSDNVPEMSTEHWLNIEKEPIKFENSSVEVKASDQWPVKHSAVVEGELVLGGLMMVHEREDNITCGPVMPQGGVQALEAMLYTLDNVNQLNIVPDVKIGAHILDDCDKDTYGLEMAVDFIKGQ